MCSDAQEQFTLRLRSAGLQHLLIGQLVKDNELHSGNDAEFDTLVMDEDKLVHHIGSVPSHCVPHESCVCRVRSATI